MLKAPVYHENKIINPKTQTHVKKIREQINDVEYCFKFFKAEP